MSHEVESLWSANPAGTVIVGTIPEPHGKSVLPSPLEWISGAG